MLCENCTAGLSPTLRPVQRGQLQGFCLFEYDSTTSLLMHAFKESRMFALGRLLAKQLAQLQPRPAVDLLVAAPSSAASFAKRGFVPAQVIAKVLGAHWQIESTVAKLNRKVADQAGLSVAERSANLAGAISIDRPLSNQRVWLVDDVTTTGATLGELAAACRAAGAEVFGFSTLAETLLKSATRSEERV